MGGSAGGGGGVKPGPNDLGRNFADSPWMTTWTQEQPKPQVQQVVTNPAARTQAERDTRQQQRDARQTWQDQRYSDNGGNAFRQALTGGQNVGQATGNPDFNNEPQRAGQPMK